MDPVIAEDERMYERSAITEWLMNHQTSPLDPSRTLSAAVLISNRAVREAIELLVDSGDIDEELRASWVERKRNYDMAKAQEMYAEGRVMDAARLGLPKAQKELAERYFYGSGGVEKNLLKFSEWARRAAEGGDSRGQFLLGYSLHYGEGCTSNLKQAIHWYTLAAEQGDADAMNDIGFIHYKGGEGQ